MFAQARSRDSLRPAPEAMALDAWMRRSLSERFEQSLREPLTGELSALVSQFQK